MEDEFPYNKSDKYSIAAYAKRLVGESLRSAIGEEVADYKCTGKGNFGHILEKYYFKYEPNSSKEPDFPEANLELKSTPLKKLKNGTLKSKERLVLNIINYKKVYSEDFETSSFLNKNSALLLVFYLYEKDKNLLDYIVKLVELWGFPAEDLKIIEDDWNRIIQKIKDGKAHEISEGDTVYLGACTKGATSKSVREQPFSGEPAMQRAFSIKQKYLNFIINDLLVKEGISKVKDKGIKEYDSIVKDVKDYSKGKTFEELVTDKFQPFIGKSIEEIHQMLELDINIKAKGYFAEVSKRILGVRGKKIAEFEKGDVIVRTIRLKPNNLPKEDISFPTFKYLEITNEEWEDSDLKNWLTKRFFFVFYKYDSKKVLCLNKVFFWNMPYNDIEVEAKKVWVETVKRIKSGRSDKLPKKSENSVCHVRPHASNAMDTYETPEGEHVVKKCFWLNASYIKEQYESYSPGTVDPKDGPGHYYAE